jgi:CheY-like chemotaxis protein
MQVESAQDLGILVVTADPDILEVIERLFGHFRIKVDTVRSAAAAVKRLQKHGYSTIVSDLELADMHGFEFSRKVREQFPELNIVLFVGATTSQVMNLILHPKVSDISEGPCRPCGFGDMLLSIINKETGKSYLLEQAT